MSNMLLVIDDAPDICRMFQRNLKKVFSVIHVASGAAEAVAILENQPITHIICDLYLGPAEQLGYELVRNWRERKPEIKYVALFTGSALDAQLSYEGIDDVFLKPDGLVDIIDTLGASVQIAG